MQHPPNAMMMSAPSDALTREKFWGELQTYLEAEIRPGFRALYEIAAAMCATEVNRAWYVVRTEAQRKAFEATRAIVDGQSAALLARAAAFSAGPARLELDPALPFPSYIQPDVHNMAGGYNDMQAGHPLAAGAIYDRALSVHRVAAMEPLVDDVGHSVAAALKERFPDFRPRRILELGCTVGHTLLPFKAAFPDAEIIGIDVAAPRLRYAAARASSLDIEVTFSQRNAEATGYADESFDLVFSRTLLHETDADAVLRIFAEAYRILRPGGVMFHSDAPHFDELSPYIQSLRDWDCRCNAEPFMDGCYALDLEAMFATAGFDAMFGAYASSLIVARDYNVTETRSGGRYFLAGAVKGSGSFSKT